MKTDYRKQVALLTLASFLSYGSPALAAGSVDSIVSKIKGLDAGLTEAPAAEYVLRKYPGEKLIPVRLMGGVNRPGVYYLPEGTDLLTAISLSAGLTNDADPGKVHHSKASGQGRVIHHMGNMLEDPKRNSPVLASNDVVFVENETPVLSSNTMLVITAVSSLMGIALGAVALSKIK